MTVMSGCDGLGDVTVITESSAATEDIFSLEEIDSWFFAEILLKKVQYFVEHRSHESSIQNTEHLPIRTNFESYVLNSRLHSHEVLFECWMSPEPFAKYVLFDLDL